MRYIKKYEEPAGELESSDKKERKNTFEKLKWASQNFDPYSLAGTFGNILNAKISTPNVSLNSNNELTSAIRQGISNSLMNSGNLFGIGAGVALMGIDKLGGFTSSSEGLGRYDTANKFGSFLPGAGWLTGKTKDYEMSDALQQMNGSYSSTYNLGTKAKKNAGAKLLFGKGAANELVTNATVQDQAVQNIWKNAQDDFLAQSTMAQYTNRGNLNALYNNQKLARAARFGTRLEKMRKTVKKLKDDTKAFFDSLVLDEPLKHWEKPYNWSDYKGPYEEWVKDVNPDYISDNYDLKAAYESESIPKEQLDRWKWAVNSDNPEAYMDYKDENGEYIYHLGSIAELPNGDYMFLKKGTEETNPELQPEIDDYKSGKNGLLPTHNLSYEGDRYYYRWIQNQKPKKEQGGQLISDQSFFDSLDIEIFQKGGELNVIPEGALHARKHHMEGAEKLTKKGIPVVSESEGGELDQQAEIERNEIIFRLDVTKQIEDLYHKFKQAEKQKEKDELAIEAGKLLAVEIMENTDDRTGLIQTVV